MKVLDLQCSAAHTFEGWFGSEQDFCAQVERGLVQCPFCGDATVHKKLSAPRLNLSGAKAPPAEAPGELAPRRQGTAPLPTQEAEVGQALQRAWLRLSQQVLARTEDVGDGFPEEARRIHYGEVPERGIRGKATQAEVRALLDEGIDLLPIAIPEHLKNPLQ
ncbi:MAG: DUF1178 family protein [Rhodoferax sp.]|nr:DUF1178 family protein [Rhodoferax sp.]